MDGAILVVSAADGPMPQTRAYSFSSSSWRSIHYCFYEQMRPSGRRRIIRIG